LRTYSPERSAAAGDWHKANHLQTSARSVLILSCPSHFEACLLELFLIRILSPKLNSMSLGGGRIYYVQECRVSGELMVSQKRRSGYKSWGFLRQRSTIEFAFDALGKVLDGYDTATGEFALKSVAGTQASLKRQKRLHLIVKKEKSETAKAMLRGKRGGPLRELWKGMKEAALNQQYHHAATLRDMFFVLRQFQTQLKRARRVSRLFKYSVFIIRNEKNSSARCYMVKRFCMQNIAQQNGISEYSETTDFLSLMTSAAELFNSKTVCKSDHERLRVNFEFLRLMLWWHDNKPEPCSLGPADDGY